MKQIIAKWLRRIADKLHKDEPAKLEVVEQIFERHYNIIYLQSRVENATHVTDRVALRGIQKWLARELGEALLHNHLIRFHEYHYPDKHRYEANIEVLKPDGHRGIYY